MRHDRYFPGRASGRRGGFTLLEILLVLLLLGLMGAVLVGGATSLLNSAREQDPEAALLAFLQDRRGESVESNRVIEVRQLPEDQGFIWDADEVFTLPSGTTGTRVRLIRAEAAGASLIGGQLEETPLESLRFYPDGSCDPARVEIRRGDARRVVVIDPWTAALLPAGEHSS